MYNNPDTMPLQLPQPGEDWSMVSRLAIASLTSQGTVGGLLLAGFVSFHRIVIANRSLLSSSLKNPIILTPYFLI